MRKGFGNPMRVGFLLRLRGRHLGAASAPAHGAAGDEAESRSGRRESVDGDASFVDGVLSWPDFGASVYVTGERFADGSVRLREERLLSGSRHAGWHLRFGRGAWQPGGELTLAQADSVVGQAWSEGLSSGGRGGGGRGGSGGRGGERATSSAVEVGSSASWVGSWRHHVRLGGDDLEVVGSAAARTDRLFTFDPLNCAPCIALSAANTCAGCSLSDYRAAVFGSVGFDSGVHYWEIKVAPFNGSP
jgi:hypothetical protein